MMNVAPVHRLFSNLANVTLSARALNSIALPLCPRTGVQNGLQEVDKATSETQHAFQALGETSSLLVATRMVQEKNFTSHVLCLETKTTVQGVRVPTVIGNSSSGGTMGMRVCFLLPATSNKMPRVITQHVLMEISWELRDGKTGF